MANIKYRKLADRPGIYGMFDRNYMLGTCTEDEMRYTLDMCERDLSSGLSLGEYGKSLARLRASILEGLNGA